MWNRVAMVSVLCLMLLAACAPSDPADAVERYLQAKVARDRETLRGLLCAALEQTLDAEAAAFATVTEARIEGMACERDPNADTVTCTGQILASYGAENTTFPLLTYLVVEEGGEWKWCGVAE
jgi:hypothetical protein